MTWLVFKTAEALADAVAELNQGVPEFLDTSEPDIASPLELLAQVRDTRKALQDVEQFIEREAAKRMGQKVVEWPNGRATRRKTSTRIRWDSEDVASAVLVAAIVDENGELPDEAANVVACRVKDALVRCAGIDAASFATWRVGELEKVGVSADEYRHSEPGRWVVEVELGEVA